MNTADAIERLIEQRTKQEADAAAQAAAARERDKAACIANSTGAIKHLCGAFWPILEPWTTFDASGVNGDRDDTVKAVITPPAEAMMVPIQMKAFVDSGAPGWAINTADPALWYGRFYVNDQVFTNMQIEGAFYYARQLAQMQAHRAANRAALHTKRLATATNILAVVAEHAAAWAAYDQACRAYAEGWTARLWAPIELWTVRYAPIGLTSWPSSDDDGESVIQEIVTLDAPADIIAQGIGARVLRVAGNGSVQERTIGAFLDATPIRTEPPSVTERLAYYPAWRVGTYYVHGRPDEGRAPTAAQPVAPSFLDTMLEAASLPTSWLQWGDSTPIPTTPEAFVERLGNHL